ncbi:MAG: BMP family ABC transporter substrate-binding protein [Burkholderiales bacterium]|nr:BMP family ABC transporter substrate-binding protein [Burkholderiales bacterium]
MTLSPSRRRLLATAVTLATTLLLPLSSASAEPFKLVGKPKIAFIYAASAKDGGWNESLDNARRVVEKEFGVKAAVAESIAEESSAVKNAIDLFVQRGFNIIVTTTYGYSDGVLEAAKKHPGVAFLAAAGTTNAANLESFYARTYEGWYLAGMAAAGVSTKKKLGVLGGFPVSVVNWDVNAFTRGAQAVDPATQAIVIYTNSWWDPVKEGQVAKAMLDQGADVIGNDLSSAGPFTAAEKAGKASVGFQLDMARHAPKGHVTSVVFRWEKHLVPTIRKIIAGTWTPSEYGAFPGMADGVVELTPLSAKVPAPVKAKIEDAKAKIIAGKLTPFDGPVLKQDGSTAVAAGASITDEALWSMDYLVKGSIGSMPATK